MLIAFAPQRRPTASEKIKHYFLLSVSRGESVRVREEWSRYVRATVISTRINYVKHKSQYLNKRPPEKSAVQMNHWTVCLSTANAKVKDKGAATAAAATAFFLLFFVVFLILFLDFVDQSAASTASTASSKRPQLGQRCNYHTSVKINATNGHAHSRPTLLTQLRGQRTNICMRHSVEKVSKQCSPSDVNKRMPQAFTRTRWSMRGPTYIDKEELNAYTPCGTWWTSGKIMNCKSTTVKFI